MWRKNTIVLLLLPLMSVLLSPGCATLTRKRTQRIPVTSSPVGATVIVNGQQQGVTPLEIRLVRKKKGQVIRIESPGYNSVEIQVERKNSTFTFLGSSVMGAAFGFGIAYAIAWAHMGDSTDSGNPLGVAAIMVMTVTFPLVDRSFGKGYDLNPTELSVTMTKADGTPRVDTMKINAEDFQNIKWIRIHRE